VASVGAPAGLAIDGVTFFLSAVVLASIRSVGVAKPAMGNLAESAKKVLLKARDGLHVVRGNPIVGYLLVNSALLNLCIVPLMLYLPIIVQRVYRLEATYYGWMETALLGGVLLGSLGLSVLKFKLRALVTAFLAIMTQGVLHVLFGLTTNYYLAVVWLAAIGLQMAVASAVGRTIFQVHVQPETRGTVFGFMNLLTSSLQPIGMSLAGVLGDTVGTTPVFVVSGIAMVAAGLVGLRLFGSREVYSSSAA